MSTATAPHVARRRRHRRSSRARRRRLHVQHPRGRGHRRGARRPPPPPAGNDEPGDKIIIGFSAPAADHGWMGSITKSAVAEAAKYSGRRAGRRPRAPTT